VDARTQEFLEYVQGGGQVETDDWMPDEYRSKLVKFIEMHGNSELMGVLPEREWILRAPTLQRKLALTAKVQDEVGHAQLIYRVVEDLGKPREQCLQDLVDGKAKFHNVFHYPTRTWGDVGVIAWLVDAAAIISQKALLKCSYAPYARIMKKICWEESFHILHGRDVILTLVNGTEEQRELVQEALDRWWGPLMHFHGNPIAAEDDPMLVWRIKSQGNEEARQQFLDGYVPQIRRGDGHVGVHGAGLGRAARRRHRPRADDRGAARLPAAHARGDGLDPRRDARARGVIYEVFRQERKGQPFQHAGSVFAPDPAFADVYAREQYGRRGESVALWIVPREAVAHVDEFPDELERNYHRVDGYSIKAKLKEARERAGTAAPGDR
jgi:ring-1,2-phenylacetyl-CoA epoxidase subunit PaaA